MNSKMPIVQSRQPSNFNTNMAKNNVFLSSVVCNTLASPYSQFSLNSLNNSSTLDGGRSAFCHIPASSNSLINHELLQIENSKIVNLKHLDDNKKKQNYSSNLSKQLNKEIKKKQKSRQSNDF